MNVNKQTLQRLPFPNPREKQHVCNICVQVDWIESTGTAYREGTVQSVYFPGPRDVGDIRRQPVYVVK